jgi:hypothetical protein
MRPTHFQALHPISFIPRREASRLSELKHTRKRSDIEEKTPTNALCPILRVVAATPLDQGFTSGFGRILACHIVGVLA